MSRHAHGSRGRRDFRYGNCRNYDPQPATPRCYSVKDPKDTPNDLNRLQFRWLLGDGNIREGAEIQYAWAYAESYTVTLQVLDDQLAMNYATAEITITNVAPSANFTIEPLSMKQWKTARSCSMQH
ncbi:MAG: PKD domain-containing protein [Candidatus Helarchaeota archaeon]